MVIRGERMSIIRTKYVVVSLPRTGTMSISQMFKDLGYEVNHVPGPDYQVFMERADMVSDTPMFAPSVIEETLKLSDDIKYIYIEKDAAAWAASMMKVGLNHAYNGMLDQVNAGEELSIHAKTDFDALNDVMANTPFDELTGIAAFNVHRERILEIIPHDRLLMYSFSQGWEPLCELTGQPLPSKAVPHLNADTMFDKIV